MERFVLVAVMALAFSAVCMNASAHGFAGKRFFPATIATDDPFVSDELSLPTLARRNLGGADSGPSMTDSSAAIDFAKRITDNFGVSVGATYLREDSGGDVQNGFDNFSAGAKYLFYRSDDHEALVSLGVDWDMGGTGAKRVGADSFSMYTPAIFFGKGFGDLPDNAQWLRPLAITGTAGIAIPSRRSTRTLSDRGDVDVERNPDVARLGFAIEYSLPYLQSFVKDVGLRQPWSRMIPVVEFDLRKPIDGGAVGWTGTVNPGVLWIGRYLQLGLEAVIHVNSRTGGATGTLLQLHFFLDDISPRGLGKPLL